MVRGPSRSPATARAAVAGSLCLLGALTTIGIAVPLAAAADTSPGTPAATTAPNDWTGADHALGGSDDGAFATAAAAGAAQGYRNFGLSLPAGSIVDGITVSAEAFSSDSSGCALGAALSGDGGASWTDAQTVALSDVDHTVILGGAGETWGAVWDGSQLADANFRLRLINIEPGSGCAAGSTTSVDWVSVQVSYRTIAQGTKNPALSAEVCDTADFNFVIDMSGSIDRQGSHPSNLQQLKDGINGFVSEFQAAGGDGRYSATRFNGSKATAISAGYVTAAAVTPLIDALTNPSGGTPTAAGINTAAANNAGDRAGAPNVMFVMTDGAPNHPNSTHSDLGNPVTWYDGANAAVAAANDARAGSGASRYVVKAVYLSTPTDPSDVSLPFSPAGDAAWASAVMTQIGGGSFLDADFRSFADDLMAAIRCPTTEPTPTPTTAPSASASPTGSTAPTASASQSAPPGEGPSSGPTASPTPSSTGEVLPATGRPQVTPPPTDASPDGSVSATGGLVATLGILLLVGAVAIAEPSRHLLRRHARRR